ncbi:fimbrial protein [Dyella solisilvae]|uniref:Fimbrial protein n=1 Tax=Dyella solisilvae TaxID=1920168 RepID=A0A370K3K6_9GAMM|nr:fimbrial protein [Dyella solisilvae]RDI97219.1 fimbrial protein [Dyella solisilvae]
MTHHLYNSRGRSRWLAYLVLMVAGCGWSSLAAAANCTASSATMTMPDVVITATNQTVGTVLATSSPVTIAFTCTGLPVTTTRSADYIATIQAGQSLATLDATNNPNGPGITFATNIPGVALLVTASPVQATSLSGNVNDGPNKYAGYPVGSVTAPAGSVQGSYGSTFTETFVGQLIVTSTTVGTGTITGKSLIPFWWYVSGGSQYSSSINMGASLMLANSTIRSGSCSVNTDSQNLSVNLPSIIASAFTGGGAVGSKIPFNINLTCKSASKNVLITMTASNPGPQTGVILSTTGSGYANNVGVQVFNNAGTPVDVTGGSSQRIATSTSKGPLSIPYTVQYYQTGSPVSAGQVNATLTFVMSYQ